MKILKHTDRQQSTLVLFFAGWSASPHLFESIAVPEHADYWICSDYRTLDFDADLSAYREITVIAWSLGVWVAAHVLASRKELLTKTIAINGTPCPIDDQSGIPEAIFKGTLDNLTLKGMQRFNRRMCGTRELTACYEAAAALRPLEEVKEELEQLYRFISRSPDLSDAMRWDKAIISSDDYIFPTVNLQQYWTKKSAVHTINGPHYPFNNLKQWDELWKQ